MKQLSIQIRDDQSFAQVLDNGVKTFLALTQGLHCSFAFGDVDDAGEHERSFVRLNRTEPNLDRHFAAVFAAAKKIAAGPHRTSGWMLEETLSVSGMSGAETFRNQHLHRLAQ